MKRRSLMKAMAAGGAALAAPRLGRAEGVRLLRFIPQADVTVLDPIWTTAYVTRNHGYMVFDTLFGTDGHFKVSPQMAAGMTVDEDGKLVRIGLRTGLKWHDNEPVLAKDCVASIRRWGQRDAFGQTLMAYTDELTAPDDRTIQFRLKRPFALLPDALGKSPTNFPAMMPERLALTDPFTQVTDMIGSGPYKYVAGERVVGSLVVYERFAGYNPRDNGTPDWTAGPKIANFDRVEWRVMPDPATAAAALLNNEADWWENPTSDILPLLQKNRDVTVAVQDPTGQMACMRLNELIPPFNNPAIRRAVLKGVNQDDFMMAVAGADPKMRHTPAGIFCPGTPMATEVGLDVFKGPRDYDAIRREIRAAGYKGEKVVLLAPTDFPILKALADVGYDMLRKCGLNVEYEALDWGTVVQRRTKKDPVAKGGWNVFHTFWGGLDQMNPAGHVFLRGIGEGPGAAPGWPSSPGIEALRDAWLDAPELDAQKRLAEQIQLQALQDVPYIPLGQNFYATAYRKSITGVLNGFVIFWNVRKA
jgi:peptide/nickel transport system substrate-binding protein